MRLGERARHAVERRIDAIEAALAAIEGLAVERSGDTIRLRGRGLAKRSIADVRLRFAGLSR